MRVILGITKDHWDHEVRARPPTKANQTENEVGQSILQRRRKSPSPLHEAVNDTKECRLGRGKSWMGQAEEPILPVFARWQYSKQTKQWERYPKPIPASLWDIPARKLEKHCGEWSAGKTESEIKLFIQENRKQQQFLVYTGGSATKDQSEWGFTVKQGATTIHEDSSAASTSSLTMEVEAVTYALCWIASRGDRLHMPSSSQIRWACYKKW